MRRLNPQGRGCIDCGKILSRHGKFRCREHHYQHMRTLIGERNRQYIENASSEAVNQALRRRFGKAKKCVNVNCESYSTRYRWVRLKTRTGRKKGIWIELCNSCQVRLQEAYPTKKGIRKRRRNNLPLK